LSARKYIVSYGIVSGTYRIVSYDSINRIMLLEWILFTALFLYFTCVLFKQLE